MSVWERRFGSHSDQRCDRSWTPSTEATRVPTKGRPKCCEQPRTSPKEALQYAISCQDSSSGRAYWNLSTKEELRCTAAKSGGTWKVAPEPQG